MSTDARPTDPRYTEREKAWLLDICDNADLARQFTSGISIDTYRRTS